MDEEPVGRRKWLLGIGVASGVAVTSLVGTAGPALAGGRDDDHGDRDDDDLSGSWLVDVVNDDGSETRSVLSLAGGGVAVVHDILPAGPPWTGTWAHRRSGFRATLYTGFPGEGGPGSPGVALVLRLRGEEDHGRISGTFDGGVLGPDDTVVEPFSGRFAGSRIEA